MRAGWVLCALVPIALVQIGCLPGDERPPPGSLEVSAEPSDATRDGFTSDDGWHIVFERFVSALGDVRLRNANSDLGYPDESCNEYSRANYDWLIDFTAAEREKVGLVYGLGICRVDFEFRSPSNDNLLGAGTSAGDHTFMRARASDGHIEDARVTLWASGAAEKAGVTKTFSWPFRQSFELEECTAASGEGHANILTLRTGEAAGMRAIVRGEELFRGEADAETAFDLIAAADVDGDGDVTFAELDEAPSPDEPADETALDWIYQTGLRRVITVEGADTCSLEVDDYGM
jgi:hypothetical protein